MQVNSNPHQPQELELIPAAELPAGAAMCNRYRLQLEAEGRFPRRVRLTDSPKARVFYVKAEI